MHGYNHEDLYVLSLEYIPYFVSQRNVYKCRLSFSFKNYLRKRNVFYLLNRVQRSRSGTIFNSVI